METKPKPTTNVPSAADAMPAAGWEAQRQPHADFDPITFSVMRGRFDAIVSEMTRVLEMSAWSSIIALAHDYSCSIYDVRLRQVSMFDALPIHTTSMHLVVREIARVFADDIHPGDVFLCNDPYSGNTHVGDYATAAPVFVDGRLVFWSVARGHQIDAGAHRPNSTSVSVENVYQEGLTIPPVRLAAEDGMRDDVLALLRANLRFADMIEGDLRAQVGAIEKGRERLVELCAQFGTDVVCYYVDELIEYAGRRAKSEFEAIPDGMYTGTAWLDSDGFDAEHIELTVTVTIDGDCAKVAFGGDVPQTRGGVNCSYGALQAAGAVPFLYYVDSDIPHNQGVLDRIVVTGIQGSICWAAFPGSTSTATFMPADAMQAAINRAMLTAIPKRVPAGGARFSNVPQFSRPAGVGINPWALSFINNAGGSGACWGADGWPHWVTDASLAAMKIHPIEQIELLYPLVVEQFELEVNSCGFGQWIGGPGVRAVVRPLEGVMTTVTFGDGMLNPPHGAMGGEPGIGGGHFVENRDTGVRRFYSTSAEFRVDACNERYVGVSTGGGGWGPPYERDAERVRIDARDGMISRATARNLFGVVLSDDADPVVNAQETAELRLELAQGERSMMKPIAPNSATWLAQNMRDGDEYIFNPKL